ncbi:MAG: hypothetical protein ACYTBX_13900 [Planctomycetota bacterium]|jgi:hypothetical protein
MSLKNPKNLLIIGAVAAALLAGTILLGNYANILPAGSDTGSQAEASQATDQTSCPMAKACPLESDAKACCSKEAEGSCPKKAEGCCPKEADGCCPKKAEGCTVKAEGSCPVKAESSCTE